MDDPITAMQWHAEKIGYLLENFDLSVHDDVTNEDTVELAKHALADLEGAIGDLIP